MDLIRNIVSLLSLAAVASSPFSGVLAPAGAGNGSAVVKYVSHTCCWENDLPAAEWSPTEIDGCAPALTVPERPEVSSFGGQIANLFSTHLNAEAAFPLYLLYQSLLFYGRTAL